MHSSSSSLAKLNTLTWQDWSHSRGSTDADSFCPVVLQSLAYNRHSYSWARDLDIPHLFNPVAQIKVMTLIAAKLFMCDSKLSGCACYIKGSIHSTTVLDQACNYVYANPQPPPPPLYSGLVTLSKSPKSQRQILLDQCHITKSKALCNCNNIIRRSPT